MEQDFKKNKSKNGFLIVLLTSVYLLSMFLISKTTEIYFSYVYNISPTFKIIKQIGINLILCHISYFVLLYYKIKTTRYKKHFLLLFFLLLAILIFVFKYFFKY